MKTCFEKLCVITLVLMIMGASCVAYGDSLQLHDGRHFEGHYTGGTESVVGFLTEGSVQYFPTGDVLLLVFGESNNTQIINPLSQSGQPLSPMSKKVDGHSTSKARNKNANSTAQHGVESSPKKI
ncbi:MAG TPA: hypothetical protein VFA74_11670 [Terriglobales bacterium]|nr:hypothetical protein [Terriglobales bacterium]